MESTFDMNDQTKGIVYVATKKDRYVAEAFLSATSVKTLAPDLPITLFTNLVESAFARASCFDTVIPIETAENFNRSWSEGQLDRIRCLPRSPYDLTLHLDSDTRVYSPAIESVFALLEVHDIAMVECATDNSYSRQHYGQPMFNVGFILFRKSDKVSRLLEMWEEKTTEFFKLATADEDPQIECLAHLCDPALRRKLLLMDQLSMVQLLSPQVNLCGLDLRILDESWNYRGSGSGRPPPSDLKMSHHPDLRKRHFSRDIALAAMHYQTQGDLDLATEILKWLDQKQPGQMDVMKMLIICQIQKHEYADVINTLDRLLASFPGYAWAESARQKVEALQHGTARTRP